MLLPKVGLPYTRLWHLIDAKDQTLGRIATRMAVLLMGKNKPVYHPAADNGDFVVVINARHVKVTGRKAEQRVYRHHSGYPGGLKEIPYERMMERNPEEIIRKAVSGMLPKNKLRPGRLDRLKIFADDQYPYKENIAIT